MFVNVSDWPAAFILMLDKKVGEARISEMFTYFYPAE